MLNLEEGNKAWEDYLNPDGETLKNKLGITNPDELSKKEAELSFVRLVELNESPMTGDFDANHLKRIHYYLFQDLYDWAGNFRNVNIAKNHSNFADYSRIQEYLDYELALMNESFKKVYNKELLANFVAEYYVVLLDIHPFRDGNGRTIREFLREFVIEKTKTHDIGQYDLDWSLVDPKSINEAMVNAKFFRWPIENEIKKAIVEIKEEKVL